MCTKLFYGLLKYFTHFFIIGSISLKARSSGSQQEPVMLWIVGEETFFNDLNGLIEGIDYSCSDVQGYICKVQYNQIVGRGMQLEPV